MQKPSSRWLLADITRQRFDGVVGDWAPLELVIQFSPTLPELLMAHVVAETSGNCFQISRAEEILRGLRQRLQRHVEQELRLGRLCQVWQNCWSTQHDQLRRQVERLEAHLTAWMPKAETSPALTLVGAGREGE